MSTGENMGMVKLHLYMKELRGLTSGYIKLPKKIYIDGVYRTDIKINENLELDITPGAHNITVEDANLTRFKESKDIVINQDTTDIYIALVYRRSGIKYSNNLIKFGAIQQINKNLFVPTADKYVKLNVKRLYDPLQQKEWSTVVIDNEIVSTGDYLTDSEFNIMPGKHLIALESIGAIEYSVLDIPADCDEYFVLWTALGYLIKVQSSYPVNANTRSTEKNIECIISRQRKFAGALGKMQIMIDEDVRMDIKNGETRKINISAGNHTISAGSVTGMETINFNVPEGSRVVRINLAFSTVGLMAQPSISIKVE